MCAVFSILVSLSPIITCPSLTPELQVVGPQPGLYSTYLHESLFWDAKLSQLPNLTRYSMSVAEMPIVPPDILDPIVHALVRCPKLAEVTWAFDVSHIHHPSLARLTNVKAIALGSPSSYALHRFVPWSEYFPALESLHIHASVLPFSLRFSFTNSAIVP